MHKLIALSLILLPLAFANPAYAGKFAGNGLNHNLPTAVSGTSSQCNGPVHHYRNGGCPADDSSSKPSNPRGGCGYYGPNGVLIRCE